MPSKSTSRTTNSLAGIQLIIALLMILAIVSAQPECISHPFPGVLPLRLNENFLINLEEYFEGSNLTFNVQPNNTHSYIEDTYECRSINEQRIGKVVNTRYLSVSDEKIIATLIESLITPGAYSVQLFKMKELTTTVINLPFGTINNCSHFAIKIINDTHFQLTVDCRYTKKLYTKNLLTTTAKFGSPISDWQLFEAPLFTYNSNMDTNLQLYNDTLIRGLYSPTNSYIEIWSWYDDARELQGLIDKTFLGIDAFYMKSMQLYGDVLVLLDYYTGLYFIKVTKQRTFTVIGQFLQPFYQNFDYNPATGLVYLGKKGKIVSATLRHNSISPLTGQSYNIYKYQKIHKIISTESYLIVLGQTIINIFRISWTTSDSKRFSLYQSKGAVNIIFENNVGQLARLLVIRNQSPMLSIVSCTIKTPYLFVNTPQLAHQVKVTGTSIMQGRSSSCEQSFSIQRLTTQKDFIYDNGFETDNQVLFANMPGDGMIELSKYGLARNLSYKVTPSQISKIDYQAKINKITQVACTIEEKKISNGGDINLAKTCDRLLIVQFSSDFTLRYYLCSSSAPINCKYILDITDMVIIDHGAHQIIQKNQKTTIILQAFVQQKQQNATILIQKIIIDQVGSNVEIMNKCKIQLVNNTLRAGNITQLEIFNGRLYVVMPLRKEIAIYDLFVEGCPAIIALNVQTCPFGYFAPRSVVFDQSKSQTKQLIMVQQWDEVLTIRLEGAYPNIKSVLLGRNNLPETVNTTLAVSFPYLIYFSKTKNRAYTYMFDDSHNLIYLRQIPLSNRTFKSSSPKRSDFAKLLDANHIAISLWNNNSGQSSLSVFKFNQLISVTQQYFILQMRKQQQFVFFPAKNSNSLIAMSLELIPSPSTQYLICKARQTSLVPSVSLKFKQSRINLQEYSENVTLVLTSAHAQITHKFKLSLSNIGNTIKRGSSFPSRGTSVQAQSQITINDNNWFAGSIFNYDFTCPDCGSRIQFRRKATLDDRQILPVPRNQFWIQQSGNILKILMGSFLVQMNYNYSPDPSKNQDTAVGYGLRQIHSLTGNGNCIDAKPINREHLIVALCYRLNEDEQKDYYLSLLSTASYKGFVIEQTPLHFENDVNQIKILLKDQIIVVYSSKMAMLFTLWQIEDKLQFVYLDQIDQEDISNDICSVSIISNSTKQDTPITNILYSLFVTQCSSSLSYITFTLYLQTEQYVDDEGKVKSFTIPRLHISIAQNINMIRLLSQNHIQIPSQAVIIQTLLKIRDDPLPDEYRYYLTFIFDKFHSYRFDMQMNNNNGIITALIFDSVFLKFGAYQAVSANEDDFFVIKYVLDNGRLDEMYSFYNQKYFSINNAGLKQYHMFQVYSLRNFHSQIKMMTQVPWHMTGSKIIQFNNQNLEVIGITSMLRAHISGLSQSIANETMQDLYSQNIIITADNPNSARSVTIKLSAIDKYELTTLEIILVVVGGLAILLFLIFMGRFAYRRYDKAKKMVQLTQNFKAEDADLEDQQVNRISDYLINASMRDSVEP